MNKKFVIAISAVCLVAVAAMIVALSLSGKTEKPQFTPPPFEAAAQVGTPTVEDTSWGKIYQSGMSFVAYMCGKVTVSGTGADLYFTNDAGNNAWLKLRIMDTQGNILAETGIIKPGEYLQTVQFTTVPISGQQITMKIMGYEPETYHSIGAVALNTVVEYSLRNKK